jgi:hypothetical protein
VMVANVVCSLVKQKEVIEMASFNELMTIVGCGVVLIIMLVMLLNFISKGYLLKLLKVKGSRGKKQLVLLKTSLEYYHTIGWMEGKMFCWKDRESKLFDKKLAKNVQAKDGMFFRLFNVDCVIIDEATNSIIMPNQLVEGGFDSILYENRVIRALNKPLEDDKKMLLLIIILCLCAVTMLAVFFGIFKILQLGPMIQQMTIIGRNATMIVGGNIG